MTRTPGNGGIGLGCELLGGTDWGPVDVDAAVDAVRFAWERGISLFDTADVYGLGLSESRLAEALGSARHHATIVTKFGVRWRKAGARATTWKDASPTYLVEALEASLRRLRIERIPLYLVHWPDGATPLEDVLAALQTQQQLGKIGAFGLSNFDSDSVSRAAELGAGAVQLPLSLVERSRLPDFSTGAARGLTTIAYGVYAQGLLTGKYGRDSAFDTSDRRHRLPHFTSDEEWAANAHQLRRLSELGGRLGAAPNEVALAWVLSHHSVHHALVGARTRAHVESALRGASLRLTPDQVRTLDEGVAPSAGPGLT